MVSNTLRASGNSLSLRELNTDIENSINKSFKFYPLESLICILSSFQIFKIQILYFSSSVF